MEISTFNCQGNSEFDKTDLAEQYSYDQHDFELTCNSWGVGADNFQLSKVSNEQG